MVEMGWGEWDRWPLLQRRGSHVFLKLFVSVLLVGISFRFFFVFSDSFAFLTFSQPTDVRDGREPLADSQPIENDVASNTTVPEIALEDGIENPQKDKCDLFMGEWISNPSGPAYTNESCSFIEPPQNCMKNGRPDTGYLYWRWKPYGCNVPPFDAERFMDVMRDKSWALIGDSILRNHVQSLICLLVKGDKPQHKARQMGVHKGSNYHRFHSGARLYRPRDTLSADRPQVEVPVEVAHDEQYKSRRWHFRSHNFTLAIIWSPFLAKAETFENEDGVSSSDIELYLDVLDENWTSQYQNFDYILISGGQWFLKTAIYWENNTIIGCHYCQGKNLTEIPVEYPFRKVLQLVHHFFTTSKHKPFILYRTWTPDHFENGEWFSGGTCNRTVPYKEGEFRGRDIDHLMHEIELEEFDNAVVNGARLKLLDTYGLSLLRPDGHSGPYRAFHPFDKNRKSLSIPNDCLHWCLPGPIDSWNDLVMELVCNQS